jgi:AraC family transcriptional regulator
LGKIAVEFESTLRPLARDHVPELLVRRQLARGDGWSVSDVICSAGPQNRPVEEQHSNVCIAIVTAGTFQYRSSAGRELMTPGSIMLGNSGQFFECGHEHGVGDRCISFAYEPRYLESLTAEAEVRRRGAGFSTLRVPPVRKLSALVARALAGLAKADPSIPKHEQATFWEDVGVELAVRALEIGSDGEPNRASPPSAEARVTRTVRMIESGPDGEHELGALAREAKLSRYHFLRLFQQLTGLTPHQYVLRARLRRAATRLVLEQAQVLDIALGSGFGDVSNFNHAFRAEFGVNPRSYRKNARHSTRGS